MRLLISIRLLFLFLGVFSFFAGLQAQSSLNNQVDQLLLRLDALEGVEANEDGIGSRESSKQAVVSPEFKDQIDQNEISVEEKIDQLLKRSCKTPLASALRPPPRSSERPRGS